MEIVSKQKYFEIITNFERVPYALNQGWLEFCYPNHSERVLYLVDSVENTQIACFAHIKKALTLKMLLVEGPCLKSKNYNSNLIKDFYEGLSALEFDIIEIISNTSYRFEFEIGMRQAGFLRPAGSFYSSISNWINLQEELKFNSNWKRNLKKSQNFNLNFTLISQPTEQQIAEFVRFYNHFTVEKGFAHQLAEASCKRLFAHNSFALGLVQNSENELTAGIIIHHHFKHAGLLYAAKNEQAKENGATFFMYKALLTKLEEMGYETFDMEKLAPSTHSTNGVFLFKDGIKGERTLYNGEWSWYKKEMYKPLMFFVKKYLFKLREM